MNEQDKIKEFLDKISQIESSGGKNVNHPTMTSGIHSGTSAIGSFGLMPNTINEIVIRSQRSGDKNPEYDKLLSMSPEDKKSYLLKNPQLEYDLASKLATKVLEKHEGDEEKAAYSWNQGHNLSPEAIEKRNYQQSPYVEKYRKLSSTDTTFPFSVQSSPEEQKIINYVSEPEIQPKITKEDDSLNRILKQKPAYIPNDVEEQPLDMKLPNLEKLLSGRKQKSVSEIPQMLDRKHDTELINTIINKKNESLNRLKGK